MNRRFFFKTMTMLGASVPFFAFGKSVPANSKDELEDFYAFCEQHTVPMPWLPLKSGYEIQRHPFKLTPAQKYMAKIIHENKYVFVVKGRQIGFSLLTAAYSAWRFQKEPTKINIYGASCSFEMTAEWNRKFVQFAPSAPHCYGDHNRYILLESHWPQPEKFNIITLDELNHDNFFGFDWAFDQLYRELEHGYTHNTPCPGKLIVGGTPDPAGRLYTAVKNPEYAQFVVLQEPVTHYPELWDGNRLRTALLAGVPERELLT